MKFRQYFNEAMTMPPHLPHLWWKETLRQAETLESQLVGKADILKQSDKIADEYGFNSIYDIFAQLPYTFKKMINVSNDFSNSVLSDRMKEYSKVSSMNQNGNTIKGYRDRIDVLTSDYHQVKDFQKFFQMYGKYFKQTNRGETDHEYALKMINDGGLETQQNDLQIQQQAKAAIDAIFQYVQLLFKVKQYLDALKERDEINHGRYFGDQDRKKMPNHKPFEILYHATPFVREILTSGFKLKKDLGREVLGGDTSNGISFTSDFRIAQAIVTALRDVVNIANGRFKIGDIFKLAQAEGISPKSFTDWVKDMKYRNLKSNVASGKVAKPFMMNNDANVKDLRDMAFDLYKTYLHKTQLRYNPLFFGVRINDFQNIDVNNIGVIMCKVDMAKIIKYLPGMEEFRAPVDAIQILKSI